MGAQDYESAISSSLWKILLLLKLSISSKAKGNDPYPFTKKKIVIRFAHIMCS